MVKYKDEVMTKLRRIASAYNIEEFNASVNDLKTSELWTNEASFKLRRWMLKTWLSCHEKWVQCFRYRIIEVAVNTNNGVERKNRDFKREYLARYNDSSLSGIVTVLVESFLPEKYKSYVLSNLQCFDAVRKYNDAVPSWLHNRPQKFVEYCMEKIGLVVEIEASNILIVSSTSDVTVFTVKSSRSNENYNVMIGGTFVMECSCYEWKRKYFPCKHILAIFLKVNGFSWNQLPTVYTLSPFFNLDEHVTGIEGLSSASLPNSHDEMHFQIEATPAIDTIRSFAPLSQPSYPKRSSAALFREHLKQLHSMSFLIDNEKAFDVLNEQMRESIKVAKENCPLDHGLMLHQEPPLAKKYKSSSFAQHPKPKKKLSGRIGVGAEYKRKYSTIEVEVQQLSSSSRIETEVVSEPPNDAQCWVDSCLTDSQTISNGFF